MRINAVLSITLLAMLAACSATSSQPSAGSDADVLPPSFSPAKVCAWQFAGSKDADAGTALGSWFYMSNDGWCATKTSSVEHQLAFTPTTYVTVMPEHGTVNIVPGRVGITHIAYKSAPGFRGSDKFTVTFYIAGAENIYPFDILVGSPIMVDGDRILLVDKEPPFGTMRIGEKILVANSSCPAGQIEEVIGKKGPRIHKCIPIPP